MTGQERAWRACFSPVDIASVVVFRVAFGAIMLWEVTRYFDHGWIDRYFIAPTFHFTYFGFGWVQPWPGNGMYFHFLGLGLLAICVMAGAWYRVSAALFFIGFTYVFLLDQTQYLNHFYLISLVSFLLVLIPAHHAVSVDAWRRPSLASDTAPAWALWMLRFQIGLVYLYGGIAKVGSDWLRGEPMRSWLADEGGFPLIGRFLTQEWAVWAFSYGGLLFDLLVVPALLWRRTRVMAFVATLAFHLTNAQMFSIGIFPWMMIAATTLFFPPSWPRALGRGLAGAKAAARGRRPRKKAPVVAPPARVVTSPARMALVGGLCVFVLLQVFVPFRHLLYPGVANWTEEGHRFSWHMKLRDKDGDAWFAVTEPASGRRWEIDPHIYLTDRQVRKMSARPDMILQFSHHLAELWAEDGDGQRVEVRADVMASLNDRPHRRYIDPTVDLAAQPRTLASVDWILPLDNQPVATSRR